MPLAFDPDGYPVDIVGNPIDVEVTESGLYRWAEGALRQGPPAAVMALGFKGHTVADLVLTVSNELSALRPILCDIRLQATGPTDEWTPEALAKRFGDRYYRHLPALGDVNFADAHGEALLCDPLLGLAQLRGLIAETRTPVCICGCRLGDRINRVYGRLCHWWAVQSLLAAPVDGGRPLSTYWFKDYEWSAVPAERLRHGGDDE